MTAKKLTPAQLAGLRQNFNLFDASTNEVFAKLSGHIEALEREQADRHVESLPSREEMFANLRAHIAPLTDEFHDRREAEIERLRRLAHAARAFADSVRGWVDISSHYAYDPNAAQSNLAALDALLDPPQDKPEPAWTILGAFFERRVVDVSAEVMDAWMDGKLSDDDISALLQGPQSRRVDFDDWLDCDFWPYGEPRPKPPAVYDERAPWTAEDHDRVLELVRDEPEGEEANT